MTDRKPRGPIVRDERGAIMVLGIFMCTCLVGALWYIAGIGDAVVYRERLQEAADATAMSTAVLHARGMNIIVMVNLAMAAVLAIRVALKVLQVALAFATIIVGGCALIPLPFNPAEPVCAVAAPLLADADTVVQDIIKVVDPIIDEVLVGLHWAGYGLVHLIPLTSTGGGMVLGQKYEPFILASAAEPPPSELGGLPLEEGTTGRLCSEAGTALIEPDQGHHAEGRAPRDWVRQSAVPGDHQRRWRVLLRSWRRHRADVRFSHAEAGKEALRHGVRPEGRRHEDGRSDMEVKV